jgi:predicted RNase H-like nuclease (RuvC/YqgF family)
MKGAPMSDLWGKIITGLITALATLVVCLINNHYQSKRHMEDMKENERRRTEDINSNHTRDMNNLKTELTAMVENLMKSQSELAHSVEMIKLQLDNLREEVSKHNKVIERTYALERKTDVQEEQIKVANNRIRDLENEINSGKKVEVG